MLECKPFNASDILRAEPTIKLTNGYGHGMISSKIQGCTQFHSLGWAKVPFISFTLKFPSFFFIFPANCKFSSFNLVFG